MPARAFGAPHTTCKRSLAGIDLADLQLVGVGMLLAFHHFRHAERFQRGLRIEQFLDLEPDAGQRLGDRLHARFRVEMLLQP